MGTNNQRTGNLHGRRDTCLLYTSSLWTNTRKRAITKEDIHKLIELDLSDRDFYTQLAKDIFLFSYFMAGINFKDIALLTYGDIDNGRIYYARRKTGKMMNCCLTEQAQEIIDKYHTCLLYTSRCV